MMEFQKEMGIEPDTYDQVNISEKGMLAIEAERKKRGIDKNKNLEDVEEGDEEEDDDEEKKEEEPVAKPGPG